SGRGVHLTRSLGTRTSRRKLHNSSRLCNSCSTHFPFQADDWKVRYFPHDPYARPLFRRPEEVMRHGFIPTRLGVVLSLLFLSPARASHCFPPPCPPPPSPPAQTPVLSRDAKQSPIILLTNEENPAPTTAAGVPPADASCCPIDDGCQRSDRLWISM